jgi:thiosulfate dehydrogenase [quinone] large subunit
MAIDRQGTGLALLRICIGIFFIFEGLGKIRWFMNTSQLAGMFANWSQAAAPGSVSHWYLERIALPGVAVFARLVPLGELTSGLALVLGFWTPFFAFVALFMALNFQIASGVMFKYSFLTSGYGLPVIGATLALALGGVRLPWSIRL